MMRGDFFYTKDYNENHDPDNGQFTEGSGGKSTTNSLHDNSKYGKIISGAKAPHLNKRYATTQKAINVAEKKICNLEYEVGVVVDSSGEVLHNITQGSTVSVDFKDENGNALMIPADCSLTHNHPSGLTFSPDDVRQSVKGECRSFRACHSNGAYVLSRQYELNGLYPSHYKEFTNKLDADFKDHYKHVIKPFISVLREEDRQSVRDKMAASFMDDWLTDNAEYYGWKYTKESK